jgi:hypothetical protein
MRFSYTLFLTFAVTGMTVLLSGCSGGGSYSVYSGYGYPYYGHGIGYSTVYYDDDYYDNDLDSRRERIEDRRENREERINNMSPEQRQHVGNRLRQTQPQRVERRQVRRVNRPARNMGRPRMGGRRR